MRLRPLRVLLLALGIVGLFAPWARAVHEETDMGEIESRPAPVSRRECVDGANAGALCNEDADCPGSTCQDRNIFNITVSVRFNASGAQLTTIQNAMTGMAASLFDVTDGQAQIGQVTILNNSTGSGGTIWVTMAFPCSGGAGCLCADSGHWASGGKIQAGIGCLGSAGAGEGLAHEFVHLVFDARDEYEARAAGCGAVTGPASCPVAASGEEGCLMDVGGQNGGGTELCWGQGDPGDLTDISGGNHDPTNVTEQSRCRSNRSCWDQVGWSWPSTFLVPAGAPDPAAGGAVVDPVVFFQPANNSRIVLVLDRSGSMLAESPSRIARLKTAALDFVNLAENGVELGLVSFSSTASDDVAIAALAADRSDYTDAINGLVALGATNIGDGLQHARDLIMDAGGVTAQTAIVLMTDGINNRPLVDPAGDLQDKIDLLLAEGIPVYVTCTGDDLGLDSQCSEIATGTMGTYVDSADAGELAMNFSEFHELIRGRLPVLTVAPKPGTTAPPPVMIPVEPGAGVADFLLLWRDPMGFHALTVEDPSGNLHQGASIPQGQYVRVFGPEPGTWIARVGSQTNDPWMVRAYLENQSLDLTGAIRRPKIEPGEPFVILAFPRYLGPLGNVQITGTVRKPDGSMVNIVLTDDGRENHSGDDAADDGVYTATFTDTLQMGAYSFDLRAIAADPVLVGHSRDQPTVPFMPPPHVREVHLSAAVNDRPTGGVICSELAYGEAMTRVAVPIVLSNGDGVAGFQFDVFFDPSTLGFVGARLGADTSAAGGWSIAQAPLGPGSLRLLASSDPPAGLGPGPREVAILDFDIAAAAPTGQTSVSLNGCILSDAQGLQLPCNVCQSPGGVVVRLAGEFRVHDIPAPVGVDVHAPLPFLVQAEALDSFGNLAMGYTDVASMRIPEPVCRGTLQPAAMAFTNGLGGPDTFAIHCCLDPLLPATATDLTIMAADPPINVFGTSAPFQGVAKGDVDASSMVNVLDVTRTVRQALLLPVAAPPSAAFQKWAADMLDNLCAVDSSINVLDVVRVRNKALLRPPLCPCVDGARAPAGPAPTGSPDQFAGVTVSAQAGAPIRVRVEKHGPRDWAIVVKGARDLGGLQIDLVAGGDAAVRVDGLAAGAGWQAQSAALGDGRLRVVAFGSDATGITGDGAVLRVSGSGRPKIKDAIASDVEGRRIAVD